MMHDFLRNNRDELMARCRVKVSRRPSRAATAEQLQNGVPLFLDQLIRTLQAEQSSDPSDSVAISGPSGGGLGISEMGVTAAQHGRELLKLGFTVDQVVHDYGDLCQAITDLAYERDAPFQIDEFRTLNRCLDNAIADAVTEFGYQREFAISNKQAAQNDERIGSFAHELRNLLGSATLAFTAAKIGNLNLSGATGSVLERSLVGLSNLIDRSLAEVRLAAGDTLRKQRFSLANFILDLRLAADLDAQQRGYHLTVSAVDADLAISGDRELLFSAVGNLLQNAFKFTHPNTEVTLSAYATADHVLIDVADHCGGLPPNSAAQMFSPFKQSGEDRSGLGLGLSIARRSVELNGGTLSVRDVPLIGCVFTICLPRYVVAD